MSSNLVLLLRREGGSYADALLCLRLWDGPRFSARREQLTSSHVCSRAQHWKTHKWFHRTKQRRSDLIGMRQAQQQAHAFDMLGELAEQRHRAEQAEGELAKHIGAPGGRLRNKWHQSLTGSNRKW